MIKNEALEWIGKQSGRRTFEDGGAAGTQCVELISTYAGLIVGADVKPSQCGNGNVCSVNLPKNFPRFFVKVDNLKDIQVGDVLSHWSTSAIQKGKNLYGHTSIVCNVSDEKYSIIEQWAGSKTIRKNTKSINLKPPTNYAVLGIARPIFEDDSIDDVVNVPTDEPSENIPNGDIAENNSSENLPDNVADEKTPPYAEPASNLKKGSKGEGVKWVQWCLTELKYDLGKGGLDGIFGNCTDIAVRDFQRSKALAVDGIVGKNTRKELKNALICN
jgi:hypothetical protein